MLFDNSAYIKLELGEQNNFFLISENIFTNPIKSSCKSIAENLKLVGHLSGKNSQIYFFL